MVNGPWIIWWLAIFLSFALLERYAFKHPDRTNTLSRFMWNLGQKFPLTLFLVGVVIGGLAVHFWWNWCPALMAPGHGG